MKPEHGKLFSTASETFGVKSRAALAQFTPNEIRHRIQETGQECDWSEAQALHAEAKKEYDSLRIMEKSLLTRASPLLPAAVRMGLKHPDVSLQDYEEWFGRETRFAGPGEVASMFSPAAYLTELYRNARKLYPEDSHWHIDNRRPDLSGLLLSQENMDKEVTALSLSNEILMEKMRSELDSDSEDKHTSSNDDVMQVLAENPTTSGTPFHLHHSRLRQACLQKDPDFSQVLAAPRVVENLSGPAMAAIYYDIPPALYRLLTDVIDENNAEEKFKKYIGEGHSPESFIDPKFLCRWYGLTDEEVREFLNLSLGDGSTYVDNTLNTRYNGKIITLSWMPAYGGNYIKYIRVYPIDENAFWLEFLLTKLSPDIPVELVEVSISTTEYIDDFQKIEAFAYDYRDHTPHRIRVEGIKNIIDWDSPEEFLLAINRCISSSSSKNTVFSSYSVRAFNDYRLVLELNKAIRLYKATGLPPRVLYDVVHSVNSEKITDETLMLLFRTAMLTKHYKASHEDALIMLKGLISQSSHGSEKSQFDRLFNDPPVGERAFYADADKIINLLPEKAAEDAEIKATLKRAFHADDDGLYALWCINHHEDKTNELSLGVQELSGMYAVSLWARALSLTPHELLMVMKMLGLPEKLSELTFEEWSGLFVRAGSTVRWLRDRGWTLGDMILMTRDVTNIPPGNDITSLLSSLRTAAVAAALPEQPDFDSCASVLTPLLAATLNLRGEATARALLMWADKAKPGGKTLADFWDSLVNDEPGADTRALTAFAYALVQRALIVHATVIKSDALALFVKEPSLLSPIDAGIPLPCSMEVIIALDQFSEWLRTLPDMAGTIVSHLADGKITSALLAQATGQSETFIEQAREEATGHSNLKNSITLDSWEHISLVLEWITLAQAFGVMPSDIGAVTKLSYQPQSEDTLADLNDDEQVVSEEPGGWSDWKRVADTFTAALAPAQREAAEASVAEGLSGALSGWLISESSINFTGVKSREALFTYFLSDNLNGSQVKTSRLAEAISSLQIFIHCALNLDTQSPENATVVREALDGQFFRDWLQWNARYSTWAGGHKLMYYPENYIDPTVRQGQTRMMDDMLQVLGQSQINTDTVGDAFMGYLTGFEEVANLETLSGYHDSSDINEGKTWFIGRDQMSPPEYWWRSLDEGKRNEGEQPPANAWTGWNKITAAPQPFGRLIRPVLYKERLYLGWVERSRHVTARDDQGKDVAWEYRWELKISWLRYDGGWSQPAVHVYPVETNPTQDDMESLESLLQTAGNADHLSLYLSVWPEKQLIIAGIYVNKIDKKNPTYFRGEVLIHDDMTFENTDYATANWSVLKQSLDFTGGSTVLLPFVPSPLTADRQLAEPSPVPANCTYFDANDFKVEVVDQNAAGTSYRLRLSLTQSVEYIKPKSSNSYLREVVENYKGELGRINEPCASIDNGEGGCALWKAQEGGSWYAYMVLVSTSKVDRFICDDRLSDTDKAPLTKYREQGSYTFYHCKVLLKDGRNLNADSRFRLWRSANAGFEVTLAALFRMSGTYHQEDIPSLYLSDRYQVQGDNILVEVSSPGDSYDYSYKSPRDYDLSREPMNRKWEVYFPTPEQDDMYKYVDDGKSQQIQSKKHTLSLQCGSAQRTWTFNVFKEPGKLVVCDVIGTSETDSQRAQYLEHRATRTRLNTLFARKLTEKATGGIDAILNFDSQELPEPPLYSQYITINVSPYDEQKHGDGKFVFYYIGANGYRDETVALTGEIKKTSEEFSLDIPLPQIWKKLGTGVREENLLYIGASFGGKGHGGTYKNYYSLTFDHESGLYTFSSQGNGDCKIPGTTHAVLNRFSYGAMDFTGANAIYFWELFYYTPMMVMQRFLQEEQYELAEKWLKYVFSPSGYIVHGMPVQRMWNVRPLEEDTSWNDEPLKTYDPDAVAQNDPMHYKLNAFMRLLDIIIGKGDMAYRKLERDTLAEAKVWYGRALTLLGEAPWTETGTDWQAPSLGDAASEAALSDRIDALSQMAEGIQCAKDMPVTTLTSTSVFLPEVNEVMLGYWEALRIRLYNLRHNLTLDGQPLNLPLFASPADPKALLASAVAAEGGADSTLPAIADIPALRFTPMLESARSMASQLIQFGSTMQQILVAQDAEALYELLNTQGVSLAASSVSLQKLTLEELAAEQVTLKRTLEGAITRRDHYKKLYQENLNAREILSLDLITSSETMSVGIKPLYVAAAAAGVAPNIFGLANGGMKYEGPINAVGMGLEIAASAMHIAGSRIQQEEMYRRRRQEWDVQYRTAEKEIGSIEAQLAALSVRETSARMQIAHMEMQSAHASAQLIQFQNKLTGKAMYSWLRGRLATIYYQYYDLTASLCLMAQKALQWEKGDTNSYLNTGTWSGAWAGLMAGEGLMLSLAQMEMAWMKHQKRELEVTRTVSLKAFFDGKLGGDSFTSGISKLLNGKTGSLGEGNNRLVYETNGGQLAIHFSLKDLNVAPDYSDSKTLRVRSISVTLPALLGPYQNVKARLRTDSTGLPAGCNECAISQAMHDNGLFTNDGSGDPRWGARWLPFEGLCLRVESGMTLSFAEAAGDQKALLESLSDVILHIQFTVR